MKEIYTKIFEKLDQKMEATNEKFDQIEIELQRNLLDDKEPPKDKTNV